MGQREEGMGHGKKTAGAVGNSVPRQEPGNEESQACILYIVIFVFSMFVI
jgi:hypothetical protein